VTFDAKIEPLRTLGGGHDGHIAVIDRLQQPAFGIAAIEPGAAPARDWQMAHIGIDIDARHETAPETEPACHRVVVDLVLGFLGGVEGFNAVGAQMRKGHGSNSWPRL
jgi:hypothetical protein